MSEKLVPKSLKREWIDALSGIEDNGEIPLVRQVYLWLATQDQKVVIVSKDGEEWQLPGGKPAEGEPWEEAAVRETYEETGVDISQGVNSLELFGFYTVTGDENFPEDYLQLRCFLQLDVSSEELDLHSGNEVDRNPNDAIRFVGAASMEDAQVIIPWLSNSDEMRSLRTSGFIA